MKVDQEHDQILALLQSGSKRKAFDKMVVAYSPMLFAHLINMLSNKENAKDVLQNTFLKAWKYLDSFKSDSKISTWLYRIASNEAYTFLKKNSRKSVEVNESTLEGNTVLDAPSPETIEDKLERALEILPDRQKQVFILRYYDAKSYEEISEILDVSQSSLKTSYHFAAKKIEAFLKSS